MRAAMRRSCVTTHEARAALAIQLEHQLEHLLGVAAVEIARGLIREHELRLRDERARNGGTLALAAGELMRAVAQALARAPRASGFARARSFASPTCMRRTSSGMATFSSAENSGSRWWNW